MAKKKTPPKVYELGQIITTESVAKDKNVSEVTARQLLIDKLSMKRVVPMYRVNTTKLSFNPWTPQLSLLNRKWNLDDGTELNGAELQNIEVGFMVCVEFT